MAGRYLIDSNVIIDYMSLRISQNGNVFVEKLFDKLFLISIISKIEILGFDDIDSKSQVMEDFSSKAIDLPLNDAVAKQTIILRKKNKELKLPDAIIAATAIVNDLVLTTNNVKDFDRIEHLFLLNPHSL